MMRVLPPAAIQSGAAHMPGSGRGSGAFPGSAARPTAPFLPQLRPAGVVEMVPRHPMARLPHPHLQPVPRPLPLPSPSIRAPLRDWDAPTYGGAALGGQRAQVTYDDL